MTIHITQSAQDEDFRPCTHDYQVNCGNCRLNSISLPLALEDDDIQQLDDIIQRSKPLQKGQHLYREGDNFQSVYAVRSGTLKAYKTTDDGREQVTGFYFPGEILGMDGISKNTHASSAKTLETSAVCEIPFSSLTKLSTQMPNLPRVDIGNYLGLTVETVNRVFSRMQKMDILRVDNKEIEILEMHGVRSMANFHS